MHITEIYLTHIPHSDSQFIEEDEEDEDEEEEEVSLQLEELTVDALDDDLTPIGDHCLPEIVALSERDVYSAASAVSTTEEGVVSPDNTEEDKDSGLDLEYPQVSPLVFPWLRNNPSRPSCYAVAPT